MPRGKVGVSAALRVMLRSRVPLCVGHVEVLTVGEFREVVEGHLACRLDKNSSQSERSYRATGDFLVVS